MKRNLFAIAAALLASALAISAAIAGDREPDTAVDAAAAFSMLKSLAGEWQADTANGKARLTYQVIAGGTTLMERETADKMPEMATVYHMDGKRLLLTHYCAAGNQPRMQAKAYDPAKREVQFRFLDATNLTNPSAGHMRNVTMRLAEDGKLISQWQFYEKGQLKMGETFEYTRVR